MDADTLGFAPVLVPLAAMEETTADKLARYRRVIFARDAYDLYSLIPLVRDRVPVIKEVLFFKVWGDVVDDDRGLAPFLGGEEYRARDVQSVQGVDDLGVLTAGKPDIPLMLRIVDDTFSRMGGPEGEEQRVLARCQSRDRFRVQQWANDFRRRMGEDTADTSAG